MAVGKQINSFAFDVTGNPKMAAFKTFELVDNTISCSINYSPTGSSVSAMWQRLLEAKGPSAGPEYQVAYQKAKKALYVNFDQNQHSQLYNDYIEKKCALEQKKVQMKNKCKEEYGDGWEEYFKDCVKASKEYIEFQELAALVEPHLDAIKIWNHGPLVRVLDHIKKGMVNKIIARYH